MKAYSIKRIGAGYHESELTESYSSASAIRRALIQDSLSESIYRQLPSAAQSIMKEDLARAIRCMQMTFLYY